MKKSISKFLLGLFISALTVSPVMAGTNPNSIQGFGVNGPNNSNNSDGSSPASGVTVASPAHLFTQIPQAGQMIGKNVIVNGNAQVAQVNGSTLVTGVVTGSYCSGIPCNPTGFTIDNSMYYSNSTGTLNQQQVTTLGSLGAPTALETISTSAHTIVATDYASQGWAIEGLNFARFGYGAAGAQAGSLQFKASCSVTGTYAGSIQNYARTRSYTFTYSCNSVTPTTHYIQNIPGDTGGSWVTTNNGAAIVSFDIGSGSNFQTAAGAWTTGDYRSVSGATGLLATNGATLTITDVQFEVGAFSTQFERKMYNQMLADCQRYLPVYPATPTYVLALGYAHTTSAAYATLQLPVSTRVPVTGYVGAYTFTNSAGVPQASISTIYATTTQVVLYVTGGIYTQGAGVQVSATSAITFILTGAQI